MELRNIAIAILSVVIVGAVGFGSYAIYTLSRDLKEARESLATETEARAKIETTLAAKESENSNLAAKLEAEQKKNGSFEDQISSISGTVGTLQKLAETDPELLAKYSKVYFLNENYIPTALTDIPSEYVYEKGRTLELHARVEPFMVNLLEAAKDDGVDLLVVSAYRSFGTQAALKSSYRTTFGSGANSFSADQGYSEHQLGTTVDFTTSKVGGTFTGFDKTPAYEWLIKNAWRYGFILSYPKGNSFYQYEPWHWRFVGKDLAERLHEDDQYFYDLDQRTIDTYLADLFD